jgi:hypothetical protein
MKPTIAEILHYAADKKLAVDKYEYWYFGGNKEKFSCCAVEEAIVALHPMLDYSVHNKIFDRICTGLENMGCPTRSTDAFGDAQEFSPENQQARYAWLKFAAKMAEEQGV